MDSAPSAPTIPGHDAPTSSSSQSPAHRAPFAGFLSRSVAAIVDGLVFGLLFFLVWNFLDSGGSIELRPALGITGAIFLAYFPISEASPLQGTLGKRFLGIKLVAASGARAGFGRALARNLAKLLTLPLLFPLPFLMSGFTLRKQSLPDILTGCLVVERSATAADVSNALPGERGSAWWLGLVVSVVIGLILFGSILFSQDGFEIRKSMGLTPPDEPLLQGSGERPEQ